MNELQINYFLAVANNLSFTRTSEELYVSQPAISRQISQLEKELDTRLFIRNNKKTELTESGRLYFQLFTRFRGAYLDTRKEVEKLENKRNKIIRIGFLEGWDLFDYLPKIIDNFSQLHPEYKVIVNCCGIRELSNMIVNGTLDAAVTLKNSVIDNPEIELYDICKVGKRIIYSASSRYAEMNNLTPSDFRNEIFLAPWGVMEPVVSDAVNSYTKGYHFKPIIQFVANHESMITCVRNGMGVAITDDWVWANHAEDLKTLPLDAEDQVSIIYIDSDSDSIKNSMVDVIKNVYSAYL